MDNFAIIQFYDKQTTRIVRLELVTSIDGESFKVGDSVMARESSNSTSELAKLIFIGNQQACLLEIKNIKLRSLDNEEKKNFQLKTKRQLISDSSSYMKKYHDVIKLYDDLQIHVAGMNELLTEKDHEIEELKLRIDLQDGADGASAFHDHGAYYAGHGHECVCNCKLQELILKLTNQQSVSLAAVPVDSSKVCLYPGSKTKVSRSRLSVAKFVASPTMYAQRLFTAVFSYEEIISATMYGTRLSAAIKRKQLAEDEAGPSGTDEDEQQPKALPAGKLTDFIESANHYFKDHKGLINMKSAISWKLNSINKGDANKADMLDWEGFDPIEYESLKEKYLELKEIKQSLIENYKKQKT